MNTELPIYAILFVLANLLLPQGPALAAGTTYFNVRDYGATGNRADSATAAIQKAIDTCAAAGGGTVFIPAGEYTSGTIELRSHVRLYLDSGATLLAAVDRAQFRRGAFIFGQDLENISLEGRGTIDGQAEWEWHVDPEDFVYSSENTPLMKALNRPRRRAIPKRGQGGFKTLVLNRCTDVRITGLSFIRARNWTIHPWGCERLVIDGIYLQTDRDMGVWADGIDPDSCRDVRIANSTIDTGDDSIVFYSAPSRLGPARPCENITVTNCRLSSASAALKFCDVNHNSIRNVTIDNVVITDSNRGIAFMVFDGGYVSDVVISNVTVEARRYDWFWWGNGDPIHFRVRRRSEYNPRYKNPDEPPPGAIRNVMLRNVIARGQGSSLVQGHPQSWLDGISLENVKLFLTNKPDSLEKAVHAFDVRYAKNLKMKDIEVRWEQPASARWESALSVADARNFELYGFRGRQAEGHPGAPAIRMDRVEKAIIRDSQAAEGTELFAGLDAQSTDVVLWSNDLRNAKVPYRQAAGAARDTLTVSGNLLPQAGKAKRAAQAAGGPGRNVQ